MKVNVISLLFIMGFCYFFDYILNVFSSGFTRFDMFVSPLFSMLYFGIIINIIYFSVLKLFKSELAFFITSWSAVIILLNNSIRSAKEIDLTLVQFGQKIYDRGDVTFFGIIYEIFDPILILAIYSTIVLFNFFVNNKKATGRT